MERDHALEEEGFGARDVLDGLARHGVGKEADEIAGMSGLERDADLAVRLEAADAGPVPRARIDDHEGTAVRIDLDALRRHDAHEAVVDRPLEGAAVHDTLHLELEHMRRRFGHVLVVLIAALAHDVPEQDAALRGVDHVLDRRREQPETLRDGARLPVLRGGRHRVAPFAPSHALSQRGKFVLI